MTIFRQSPQKIGERLKRLLTGEKPDRPLVWLWGAVPAFAVQNAGYPKEVAYNDPEKAFQAQLWAAEMFGIDNAPSFAPGGASDVTWAFGGEIKWPTGEYDMAPVATRHPVETEAAVADLRMPDDITTAGPMPLYLRFAELQKAHGLPHNLFLTSPQEGARSLCGPELLMRWMIKRPELSHRLLRLATDYSIAVVRLWVRRYDPKQTLVYLTAPTASNQMISPKLFEKFVLPYQKELHEEILATEINTIFCHICGEHNRNLPFWSQIPMGNPGIVSVGHEIDIETAVEVFGEHSVIAGNVEPAVVHLGTPEQVYDLCIDVLEKGRHAPWGQIMMAGCGLPPQVPPYNQYMFIKAVADFCAGASAA